MNIRPFKLFGRDRSESMFLAPWNPFAMTGTENANTQVPFSIVDIRVVHFPEILAGPANVNALSFT